VTRRGVCDKSCDKPELCITYRKVDADTGDEVESTDIIKGYQVGKGEYLELDPEELEAIAKESKRTIEIDEFVPRKEIDKLYLNSPYYIVPDGEVGQQAFAVIREPSKVVNLMEALRRSVETERAGGERRKPAPRTGDHRAPKKAGRSSARAKKAS
jgi:non-homologous end joining protein Ku